MTEPTKTNQEPENSALKFNPLEPINPYPVDSSAVLTKEILNNAMATIAEEMEFARSPKGQHLKHKHHYCLHGFHTFVRNICIHCHRYKPMNNLFTLFNTLWNKALCSIGCHLWEYPGGTCASCGKQDKFFDQYRKGKPE